MNKVKCVECRLEEKGKCYHIKRAAHILKKGKRSLEDILANGIVLSRTGSCRLGVRKEEIKKGGD